MIRKVPFTIANGATVSGIVDLGSEGNEIVAVSIHGTWTAGKVGFQGYVPGSATTQDAAVPDASVAGGTAAWVGGPYDSTAAFDTIKDTTGAAILYGNGTDTTAQFLVIASQNTFRGLRYVKVTSAATQLQAVTGWLLVQQ